MDKRVLVINPGATSTKVAVFEEERELLKKSIIHTAQELEGRFISELQLNYSQECKEGETMEILRGLQGEFQKFHQVRYTDGAIAAAVTMSGRYLPQKCWPDKAVDLMDEAAAMVRLGLEQRVAGTDRRKRRQIAQNQFSFIR